ncbi:hypothetical protein D3X12_26230 [Pseudomonas protegens]|uniref:Uncharacterized protein n=2 Tax=Pseudomonas protegens TaxID=380021 RepID=Q4K927_PSEF5|nr:hypothetical protein [Pseudomonas protegens]AAY93420.1 conserved hypothetical protein [Pseudomonas protegens Pf-5]ASE22410.1 hypothetical protein CEP86_18720 [Pseudomonas protegens]QEZ53909.1 hypothetical protein D3X12_26230 [Pseudomonas protegens]QEZ59888.1 hypothetical protein D4N38_25590 [Pseudomonas protegens]QEZ65193.1 hypothetical protein D4N37_21555 [Pseudomonas protegens]
MSGPKVVRIVTREEILEICAGHLRRLEQAIARWEEQAQRLGQLTEQERAATHERFKQLRQLIEADRLLDLQKQVPIEIQYLKDDLQQRENRAVQQATQQRQLARRQRENATTLLGALQGKALPTELLQQLQALADGQPVAAVESILAQGFASLGATAEEQDLSEAQQQLARRLQGENTTQTLAQWRAAHEQKEPRLERIEQHIAQLLTLDHQASAEPYLAKLRQIDAETREQQRNLLLDSLVLELAQATRDSHERRARLVLLQELANEVAILCPAAVEQELVQAGQCSLANMAPVDELIARFNTLIEAELQQRAALARRQAVLEGLASLGYEVREGMATAWAKDGRVVLRKSATPGYGVEVGGTADNGRLQVRAVALSAQRDTQRDKDIETIWCGEFQRLQALLAAQGDDLSIEKALAVGAVPLKEVQLDNTQQEYREQAQQRT